MFISVSELPKLLARLKALRREPTNPSQAQRINIRSRCERSLPVGLTLRFQKPGVEAKDHAGKKGCLFFFIPNQYPDGLRYPGPTHLSTPRHSPSRVARSRGFAGWCPVPCSVSSSSCCCRACCKIRLLNRGPTYSSSSSTPRPRRLSRVPARTAFPARICSARGACFS